MTTWLLITALILAAAAAVWQLWWLPLCQLRTRLDRLADPAAETTDLPAPRLSGLFARLEQPCRALEERVDEMQRQLTDESLNLRTILGGMVEGVLIVDGRQHIRLINAGMQQMVPGHLNPMNRSIMEVFRNHELQIGVRETLEEGVGLRRELRFDIHDQGVYYPKHFAITCVPLQPATRDRPMGAILVFHDITRLKELEAIRRDFVANVSHELRTPLSIIKGYLETLLDGALDDPGQGRKFCTTMLRHADRLNLLIEDVLSLARLESGRISLHLTPVDLAVVCQSVKDSLEQKITSTEARLIFQFEPGFPTVKADVQQLEQAFFNLFDNALKYSSGKRLELAVTGHCPTPGEVELRIADNGPGIPLEDQPHLFERFYRVHKDRSRDAGGTGLGLSIVKHIITGHDGTVSLESEPGRGATFILRLPVDGPVISGPDESS